MNPLRWLFRRRAHRSRSRRRDPQSLPDGDQGAHRGRRGSGIGAARRDQRVRQRAAGQGRRARRCGAAASSRCVTDVWQDVRFGTRMLVKNPGFSLVVIAVLSLGIAGNAAIFSLFKGIALKPLPGVRESATSSVMLGRTIDGRGIGVSVPDYRDIAEHQQSFERLTGSMMIFAEPRSRRRRAARDRGARRRQLLRDARRRRATGPHAAAVGRCGAGPASGRGDRRLACGADRTPPIPAIARQDDLPQRPAADHRRRRRAGVQRHDRQHGHRRRSRR